MLFFSFARAVPALLEGESLAPEDGTWLARLRDVLTNHEERLPDVGKYNAGQKVVFWSMSILHPRADFAAASSSGTSISSRYTSIEQKRIGHARPCARRDRHHLRVDRARLRGDLGARYDRRHDHAARSLAAGPGGIIANGLGNWSPARPKIAAPEPRPSAEQRTRGVSRGPWGS